MNGAQASFLAILAATIGLFIWGRWRHDIVAVAALLGTVALGLVPVDEAFAGFSHPAVLTVAFVLILSRGLQISGAVDFLARRLVPVGRGPTVTIASLTALVTLLSAFMNNIGALALLMPIAIQVAGRLGLQPGQVLMPLAFGSLLGGMTTLIGTPPNLIVSGFRNEVAGAPFGMFDFTPVGLAVAGTGVLFIALVGWRLVPARRQSGAERFETGKYVTEVRVADTAKVAGQTLREIEQRLGDMDAQIIGLVRNELRLVAPHPARKVRPGDILVIEAEPEALASTLSSLGLKLEEAVTIEVENPDDDDEGAPKKDTKNAEKSRRDGKDSNADGEGDDRQKAGESADAADVLLMEYALLPASTLAGRSATEIELRSRFGINLLAISRQGRRTVTRLRTTRLQAGDVLLLQGTSEAMAQFAGDYGCVPLAQREIRLPDRRRALLSTGILAAAVTAAALGFPAAISFMAGVFAAVLFKVIPARAMYDAVDWPVIVLLAALIPVAGAMAATGTADLVARALLSGVARGEPVIALALVLVVTMTLSDFMNNAATAAVMCPIAIGAAAQLGSNADAFLMAVAIGGSCAFLTPIGHQNSTLILGPGGFRFGDYWRLGLPLEILVAIVAIPMLLVVWPL